MCVNNLSWVALDSGEARIQTFDRKSSDLTTRPPSPTERLVGFSINHWSGPVVYAWNGWSWTLENWNSIHWLTCQVPMVTSYRLKLFFS